MKMPVQVLFLCTGNSARSIMAEAAMNALAGGRFRAFSAGSQPRGEVHPAALAQLAAQGLPLEGLRSKSWDEFAGPDAPRIDVVITVCGSAAAETCPVWPGHPLTAHWGMPDPAAVDTSEAATRQAFHEAYTVLCRRIDAFAALPLDQLDEASLRQQLEAIGQA